MDRLLKAIDFVKVLGMVRGRVFIFRAKNMRGVNTFAIFKQETSPLLLYKFKYIKYQWKIRTKTSCKLILVHTCWILDRKVTLLYRVVKTPRKGTLGQISWQFHKDLMDMDSLSLDLTSFIRSL